MSLCSFSLQDYLSGVGVNFSGFHDNPAVGASIEELMRGMDENATYKHFEVRTYVNTYVRTYNVRTYVK